ncbi:hypothetical protein DENSPDRAFT_835813 [Dentipellis sp. KUC8613]|nr:hypothetical protein DENSPDRAFT_835813 [Dentipellis sp. KUC8613]
MMDFNSDNHTFLLALPDIEGFDGFDDLGADWLRLLKVILSTLPRDCIRALELTNEAEMPLTSVQWAELFASALPLPQLELVMISDDYSCQCLSALLDLDVNGIPKMRDLILDADATGLDPALVGPIAHGVQACRGRGVPLQYIKLNLNTRRPGKLRKIFLGWFGDDQDDELWEG